ncbi:hypothetical protein [Tenacibaculum finnmarkense]|uniref:hypothetical protein n=1 Tax=Tenacibaculum finnmarkense TaxID=2781243 RepID=UPI001E2D2A85|nr:hypothetical protein [Tenacibaculum finnmarkense]MCD8423678.1 hypothetical protein [Tenacibaculum finnmarkense genomovar ulcerans]MCG8239817.1 hypothetical protein [Tenacibaculum finnmarkense genomovar ulcerans]
MRKHKIDITKKVNESSENQRFGGNSFLPIELEWPINSNNEKLVLIFSLPTSFLNKYCETTFNEKKWISVFSTYNNDYFLDEVIDNGDILDSSEKIFNNFTQVIIHKKGEIRNESNIIIPSYLLKVELIEENNNENSKLGGKPIFLQNVVEESKEMNFCFQFYAGKLPEFKNILFLEDSILYLFVSDKESNYKGIFFGQCT